MLNTSRWGVVSAVDTIIIDDTFEIVREGGCLIRLELWLLRLSRLVSRPVLLVFVNLVRRPSIVGLFNEDFYEIPLNWELLILMVGWLNISIWWFNKICSAIESKLIWHLLRYIIIIIKITYN